MRSYTLAEAAHDYERAHGRVMTAPHADRRRAFMSGAMVVVEMVARSSPGDLAMLLDDITKELVQFGRTVGTPAESGLEDPSHA